MKKIITLLTCAISAAVFSGNTLANTAAQTNKKLETKSSYSAIAVGAREAGKGSGTLVLRLSKQSLIDAENQALQDCRANGGLKCQIMQSSANMCNAVAIGKVKDSKKVRLYAMKLSEADKKAQQAARRFNAKVNPGSAIYQDIKDANKNALEQCTSDPSVDPSSCKIQSADCAFAYQG